MKLGERLRHYRQITELMGIAAGYHALKMINRMVDTDEGVIEFRLGQLLARHVLRHLDMDVDVVGIEKLSGLRRYCVVSTHASYLDWAVLLGYIPDPLRFIAKKELSWVPVVGDFLRTRGIFIDRGNRRSAITTIREAARQDVPWPILIFPEGTRTPDGAIKPFKKAGVSLLAEEGMTLVPVCILGTFAALPRHERLVRTGRKLKLVICDPVAPADHPSASDAVQEVERRIHRAFREHGGAPA